MINIPCFSYKERVYHVTDPDRRLIVVDFNREDDQYFYTLKEEDRPNEKWLRVPEKHLVLASTVVNLSDFMEGVVYDTVSRPAHYNQGDGIECIDYIQQVLTTEEFIGYLRGNMIKYNHRANYKGNKDEDLEKANWYSNKLTEFLNLNQEN